MVWSKETNRCSENRRCEAVCVRVVDGRRVPASAPSDFSGLAVTGRLQPAGTNPENFLNSIGRKKDGSGGDILLWKRKAERYLVESGLTYTIIHPGGLVDQDGAQRELVVGVNDEIMKNPEFSSGGTRSVARADVARVCKAALGSASATNFALDLVSKKAGDGTPTKDASTVFASSPGKYTYESAATDPPSIF